MPNEGAVVKQQDRSVEASSESRLWEEMRHELGGTWQAVFAPLRGSRPVRGETRHLVGRIYRWVKPYRGRLVVGLALAVTGSLAGLASPVVWRYLVDAIVPGGDASRLGQITLLLLGIYLLGGALGLASGYLLNLAGLRLTMDLRLALYEHLQTLSLGFFGERRTGELVSRVMNDVRSVRALATDDLAQLLRHTVFFFGALGLILVTDWRLTAFLLLLAPPVALIASFVGRLIRRLAMKVTDGYAEVTTVLEEALSSIRTVRTFVREDFEIARFRKGLAHLLGLAVRQVYLEVMFGPLLSVLFFTATVVLIWFGGRQVLAGALTVGQLVTFLILTSVIGSSLSWVGGLWTRLQSTLGTCDRIFRLLDTPPDLVEAPDAQPLPPVHGRLSFEAVTFAYPGGSPVLEEITLDVAPGETLAVVGPSGAGKTTLLNLVPRLYDPSRGRVTLDGVDLRSVTVASLRRQIALVPQETQLFGGTVRENLLYGRLDATDDELAQAARAANAEEFIFELARGYDTVVGERGVKLSGGQRQRLAIARALLRDPRILLLDEATSALDSESETLVQDALEKLMKGRTTVVVAHRLSTVRKADRIAVLDRGRLEEVGTHAELLERDGLYARLYRYQFRGDLTPMPARSGLSARPRPWTSPPEPVVSLRSAPGWRPATRSGCAAPTSTTDPDGRRGRSPR